jgi:hypothetical protein
MDIWDLLKPWLWYFLCALSMCVMFCGLERSKGSLSFFTKSFLCCWCLFCTIITISLYGYQSATDLGVPPNPEVSAVLYGASLITCCISSCCVYSAAG